MSILKFFQIQLSVSDHHHQEPIKKNLGRIRLKKIPKNVDHPKKFDKIINELL